jgi:phosphatidylinositol-3-phosphatase
VITSNFGRVVRAPRRARRLAGVVAAGGLVVAAFASSGTSAAAAPTAFKLPKITHVWNILLENEGYAATFGSPAADPYLATTLRAKGALLTRYYGTGHHSNDNYISLVSGQPPNPANQTDCKSFSNFTGGAVHNGIETGVGCVYPTAIATIGNQLTSAGRSWKAYEQDMGNDPAREAAACGHPAVGAFDGTQKAEPGDGYATRHDPFVYFHAVINAKRYCNKHVVALGTASGAMPQSALPGETGLATNLKKSSTMPAYSFITPNLCADGHDYPCKNTTGHGSALKDIDAFLKTWVPMIMKSQAYKSGGLIEITFDEASSGDTSACCGETGGPAAPNPGIKGPGGGKVGAVLISPFIKPGTTTSRAYNHYSTLATDERIFGLARLGDARTVTTTFGKDVFTAAG